MPDVGLCGGNSIDDYRRQADSFVTVLSRSRPMRCSRLRHGLAARTICRFQLQFYIRNRRHATGSLTRNNFHDLV
jgi:hypothetical protein